MPHRGDIDQIGVGGMNADLRNVIGVAQPHILPCLAPIGRFVDAVAIGDITANCRFAGAGIDHIRIRFGDGDGAHCGAGQVTVGDIFPVDAAIGRLPNPAADGTEIEGHALGGVTGHGNHAATTWGTDAAPGQRLQKVLVDLCCGHGCFVSSILSVDRVKSGKATTDDR